MSSFSRLLRWSSAQSLKRRLGKSSPVRSATAASLLLPCQLLPRFDSMNKRRNYREEEPDLLTCLVAQLDIKNAALDKADRLVAQLRAAVDRVKGQVAKQNRLIRQHCQQIKGLEEQVALSRDLEGRAPILRYRVKGDSLSGARERLDRLRSQRTSHSGA